MVVLSLGSAAGEGRKPNCGKWWAGVAGTPPAHHARNRTLEPARVTARYELTTATASISIMKSGPARRVTPTVVLVGVATPRYRMRMSAHFWNSSKSVTNVLVLTTSAQV